MLLTVMRTGEGVPGESPGLPLPRAVLIQLLTVTKKKWVLHLLCFVLSHGYKGQAKPSTSSPVPFFKPETLLPINKRQAPAAALPKIISPPWHLGWH